ncbi:MAG TPA: GAF domain-containing protein [Patescibacteria group bacterium]|nr:GAF domain-containing protein [Patescibacteria group bacterium]
MQPTIKIAILGGGEEELTILSEFHRTPGHEIIAIYDRDPLAVAMEISEIIGVPAYSDDSFAEAFHAADYIIIPENRSRFQREIAMLQRDKARIVNPTEAANYLGAGMGVAEREEPPWPAHLDEALKYIDRITDRGRLLRWLLEVAVRSVQASSGSLMLHSPQTDELYIGYATGLSDDTIKRTRQRMGEGIAGEVAETRIPKLITEIIDTTLYARARERPAIQSAISAPLAVGDRLLGVLNVSTNRGEKQLGDADVALIELLASKIAPILEQHLKINANEIREIEYRIRTHLESLFSREISFHDMFTFLCRFIAEQIEADTVTVYTATDEGNWLILGGSDQQIHDGVHMPRIHCIKGSLAKAYLNGEEVLMTEARQEAGLTLKLDQGAITSIYLPLVHEEPLGVLVVEISSPAALERFFRIKETIRFQVSFFTYTQLRETRQARSMERLEELSALTPRLIAINDTIGRIKKMPELLSFLVGASLGSFFFTGLGYHERAFFNFPTDETMRQHRMASDAMIMNKIEAEKRPICTSFLSVDVDMSQKPPLYRSIIAYPLLISEKITAIYIGYDKVPTNPLDSSIFVENDIELLRRVSTFIEPLFTHRERTEEKRESLTFDDLLRTNQRIFLDRMRDEIERASRYHHGFTVTIFKINGLKELLDIKYQDALRLINELSIGIRRRVRRTDYFCWIESDLFGVLSLESYKRVGFLENRINGFITDVLKERGLYDPESFYISSSYTLYPGSSDTPADLISEAKSKLK